MRPYAQLLQLYEQAVYQRRTPEANALLLELVRALNHLKSNSGLLRQDADDSEVVFHYTQVAAAVSTHVRAPDFVLNMAEFYELCNNKQALEALFVLSGFNGAMHLVQYFGQADGEGTYTLQPAVVFFLALFFSLDNIPESVFDAMLLLPPNMLLPLMLGWLSNACVFTAQGEVRRARLLRAHERISWEPLPNELRVALARTYMHCSYSDAPDKHEAKRSFNKLWIATALRDEVSPKSVARRIVPRPRLLILNERMCPGHAMDRCYGPAVRQLHARFDVTTLNSKEWRSYPDGDRILGEVQAVDISQATLRDIAGRIVKCRPDIIYYPSVGMSDWPQVMSNFRLAPVQFMTPGHPATTYSDNIDYMLLHADLAEAWHGVNEVAIIRRGNGWMVPPITPPATPCAEEANNEGAIQIAINSNLMKLSYRLLNICTRIEAESRRAVHFHFFSAASGIAVDDLKRMLAIRLRNFTAHPYMQYSEFSEQMSKCHLALAAFPFGNTNSTVDTSLLGIPVVAYVAPEPLSLGDKLVMDMIGLPKWLLAADDDAYYQTAMRLIHDDGERAALRKQLLMSDVADRLFKCSPAEDENEFVDAVWWMYENHERIQASGHRHVTVGQVLA